MDTQTILASADKIEDNVTAAITENADAVKDGLVKGWELVQKDNQHVQGWIERAKNAVEGELNAAALHFAKFFLNAANYFAAHAHIQTFHFTSDGQAFFTVQEAADHAPSAAKLPGGTAEVTTVNRADIAAILPAPSTEAAAPATDAATKTTASAPATDAPATDAAASAPATDAPATDAAAATDVPAAAATDNNTINTTATDTPAANTDNAADDTAKKGNGKK